MQLVPITTDVVSSNLDQVEVYDIMWCNIIHSWLVLFDNFFYFLILLLYELLCNNSYLWNQCLWLLTLRVRIPLRWGVLDTTLCDKVCQWLATGQWFSPGPLVSSTNKTDRHNITDILLKVALTTIKQTSNELDRIGAVMVIMFASSVVDCRYLHILR